MTKQRGQKEERATRASPSSALTPSLSSVLPPYCCVASFLWQKAKNKQGRNRLRSIKAGTYSARIPAVSPMIGRLRRRGCAHVGRRRESFRVKLTPKEDSGHFHFTSTARPFRHVVIAWLQDHRQWKCEPKERKNIHELVPHSLGFGNIFTSHMQEKRMPIPNPFESR